VIKRGTLKNPRTRWMFTAGEIIDKLKISKPRLMAPEEIHPLIFHGYSMDIP